LSHRGAANELLFSYGTLQLREVQLATFGRSVEGQPDALAGYRMEMIRIHEEGFSPPEGELHRIIHFTGLDSDRVPGTLLTVTTAEIEQADAYEPPGYTRALVQTVSGVKAWAYVAAEPK